MAGVEKSLEGQNAQVPANWPLLRIVAQSRIFMSVLLVQLRLSRQSEKFLFGQNRKFLLTALRLEGWNESR